MVRLVPLAADLDDPAPEPVATVDTVLRAVWRICLYAAVTLPAMPIQAFLLLVNAPAAGAFPKLYHRVVCSVLGLRVEVRGRMTRDKPVLFVSNHTSYLDIEILGSLIRGSFIAKAEVADWPVFGWLAKLQRTVFVDRRRGSTGDQRDRIAERLDAGGRLILFAEGTSNDGNRVLPFKSALFSVAERKVEGRRPLTVQPVSIAYAGFSNMPMGRDIRPFYAWYGDMDMGPHVWRMIGLGTVTVVVEFHEPVTLDSAGGTRRDLARHCERVISDGLADALTGRRRARKSETRASD